MLKFKFQNNSCGQGMKRPKWVCGWYPHFTTRLYRQNWRVSMVSSLSSTLPVFIAMLWCCYLLHNFIYLLLSNALVCGWIVTNCTSTVLGLILTKYFGSFWASNSDNCLWRKPPKSEIFFFCRREKKQKTKYNVFLKIASNSFKHV